MGLNGFGIINLFSILFLAKISFSQNGHIGVLNSNVGQFPYQVSLQSSDGSHICGGSIINERYILIAAHCVAAGYGIIPFPTRFFQVRVGSIKYLGGGQLVHLKHIIVHEEYKGFLNDLALLELEVPLKWTNNIKPIEIITEDVKLDEEVTISGWGHSHGYSPISYQLKWTTLNTTKMTDCNYGIDLNYDDCLICLLPNIENDEFNSDSGGSATYKGKLIGIANFVEPGYGKKNGYAYTKIYHHNDWIIKNMRT